MYERGIRGQQGAGQGLQSYLSQTSLFTSLPSFPCIEFFFHKTLYCPLRSSSFTLCDSFALFLLIYHIQNETLFLLAKYPLPCTILCTQPLQPSSLSTIPSSFDSQSNHFSENYIHSTQSIKQSNMRASSIPSLWAMWAIVAVLAEPQQSVPPKCHTNRCLRAFERPTQQPEASSYCSRFLGTVIEPIVVTEVAQTTATFTFANATITQAEATTTVTE